MAKDIRKFAATSNMVRVFIADSSSTTGAGLTGVVYTSTGLVIDLIADNSATAYHYKSAATATIEDITTIGTFAAPTALNCRFKPVDATNFPGLYEIQFLDGVFDDASCKALIGRVAGVTNMAPTFFEIQLVAFDPQDAVRLGLTALPNAAAEAAGGLYTRGTGAGQIKQDANGRVDTNVRALLDTAWLTPAVAGTPDVNMKLAGGGTVANGAIPNAVAGAANGLFIAGTNAPVTITGSGSALTLTSTGANGSGLIVTSHGFGSALRLLGGSTGVGLNIAGGTASGDGVSVTTTSGHGINLAPVGTNMHGVLATGGNGGTSDGIKAVAGTGGVPIRGDITGNITGNLSGSAGSVTGAVGSVTGAVGSVTGAVGSVTGAVASVSGAVGSVTGAVGSVTGAVGSVTGNVGGNVTGSVGSVAAGGITAASIADAAIDNATFAADVGSTAIATNVIGIAAKKGVVDALNVDTYAEPGQGTPAATATFVQKIGYLYKNWRNKKTQTATQWSLLNDDAVTVDQKATTADDATTASKTEIASGP